MSHLLLIEPDRGRALGLEVALEALGVETLRVEEPVFALAAADRRTPHAVAFACGSSYLTTPQVLELLKSHSALSRHKIVVYGRREEVQSVEGACGVIVGRRDDAALIADNIVAALTAAGVERAGNPQGPPPRLDRGGRSSLAGSLDIVELAELMAFFQQTGSTGRLRLCHGCLEAEIYYIDGAVIHATGDDVQGEQAVRALLDSTALPDETSFEFTTRAPDDLVDLPRTIWRCPLKLLRSRSADDGHPAKRAPRGPVETAGPSLRANAPS